MEHLAKIIIVGAGKGGLALLELFHSDPTIEIIGVVDRDIKAPGMHKAQELGLPTSRNISTFLIDPQFETNLIIDASGNQEVWDELQKINRPDIRVIGGVAAKFIWALLEAKNDKKLLEKKYEQLKSTLESRLNDSIIFGTNPMMRQVKMMIKQVAPTHSTVLIVGETGTGKEVIAEAIQRNSLLKDEVFLKINCTAFSPHLLESELFGHLKGSFTGASSDKEGLLGSADGGTIFLDEIGDISLKMQVKLLRFLQFGEIKPVGSTQTRIVKTRIIAATNRNLGELIKEKAFREDLYYRLNTFTIELPPLRLRQEDIPLLTQHFFKQAIIKLNKKVSRMHPNAQALIYAYQFPGNLRELQSVIEHAVIMCNGDEILPEHLPLFVQNTEAAFRFSEGLPISREKILDKFERSAILHYLTDAKGNVSKAAMIARVPRRTFYRIMKKYDISKGDYLI